MELAQLPPHAREMARRLSPPGTMAEYRQVVLELHSSGTRINRRTLEAKTHELSIPLEEGEALSWWLSLVVQQDLWERNMIDDEWGGLTELGENYLLSIRSEGVSEDLPPRVREAHSEHAPCDH